MKAMKRILALTLIAALLLCCVPALAEGDWLNVLLLGCDSYSINNYSRTDSMIIVSMNLKTNQVKMYGLKMANIGIILK